MSLNMRNGKLHQVTRLTNQSLEAVETVTRTYPFLLSKFLSDRLEAGTYSIAAARQFLPDTRELDNVEGWSTDPCNETQFKQNRSIIQKYNNRAALVVTERCLVYCRFCFRKDFVGFGENAINDSHLDEAVEYLRAHPENRDVLITGGDPLAIPNSRLIPFLERLSQIEHLKVVRIHSRALSVLPERLDQELIDCLRRHKCFWFYAHMNHPDDVNHPDVLLAAARLLAAGVPVFNQSVLLGGVNDDPATIKALMLSCYENKIVPYNLYLLDRVRGASHFAVSTDRVMQIFKALGELPGPAQPAFVVVDENNAKRRLLYDSTVDLPQFLANQHAAQLLKHYRTVSHR